MPVIADWQKLLPAYSARPSVDELIWFTRGQPLSEKTMKLDGVGAFADLLLSMNGKPVHVGVVDVWADPLHPRTNQIREVFNRVQNDTSAIVMGDFNTPADSVHFIPWRDAGFQDSFKEAGRGWRETWFYGLPILSLDHVWAGKDWRVIDCKKQWSLSSDHAALMVRLVPR
jgi:endonuclease/exonuclease/phosphatase (EEP) superfamily protein YafD